MQVNLVVEYKTSDGKDAQIVFKYANPNVSDVVLRRFVDGLMNLTNNQLSKVFKEVNKFLTETDTEFVTDSELNSILNGTFVKAQDDDPIDDEDLQSIVDGNYTNTPDDDPLTDEDFIF